MRLLLALRVEGYEEGLSANALCLVGLDARTVEMHILLRD